jgi:D-alanyl-lipoteichoic acid acyltransferase DltB (MBOAT superfamily)
MLFNSYEFLFAFLPAALAGCFLLARFAGPAAAQLWLIAASFGFYAAWNVVYLPLLIGSIVLNYVVAGQMVKRPAQRGKLLALGVAVDLALLGYYKYTNFFLSGVDAVTGLDWQIAHILLPLGISFYTFQQITLLVDVSGGHVASFRLRDFALFITFFPHLIAGPIVHHKEMMPQFEAARWRFDWGNMAVGASLFSVGLFKKTVLADGIAPYVSPIFATAASGQHVTLVYAWLGVIGYLVQLYFDFSGYSEMALGLARVVGIKLPMNFNSPLKATSIVDFWNRWHITLTRFLTAYLYNPIVMARTRRRMAKGRKGLAGARTTFDAYASLLLLPTVITFVLSGLWHGAGLTFIAWGALHAAYLAINQGWRLVRPRIWKDTPGYTRAMRAPSWALTFVCVCVAMAFFRADSLGAAGNLVAGMFGLHGAALPSGLLARFGGVAHALAALGITASSASASDLIALSLWVACLLAIALALPNVLEMMRPFQPAITMPAESTAGRLGDWRALTARLHYRPVPAWAAALAVLMAAGVLAMNRTSEFLYWQF